MKILKFFKKVKFKLGDRMSFKYETYANYVRIPFLSFYVGLKYIMEKE